MTLTRALLWGLLCWACAAVAREPATTRGDFDGIWLIQNAPSAARTAEGHEPPLLPKAKAEYEAHVRARKHGDISYDKTSWCAAAGVPRLQLEPYPFEILVNPRQTAFLYQWNRWARLIDMTGNDLKPLYAMNFGTGNGHFEGDVLVVVTRGLDKDTYLDHSGLPHGDDLVLTERLRLLAPDVLEDRIHIDDPDTYSKPWDMVARYRRQASRRLREDVCLDRIKQGKPAI